MFRQISRNTKLYLLSTASFSISYIYYDKYIKNKSIMTNDMIIKTEIALNNLPSLIDSQKKDVLVFENFLDKNEIDLLLNTVDEIQSECGISKRDKNGIHKYKDEDAPWKTIYLHTNREIQKKLPQLFDKIMDRIKLKDKETYNLLKDKENLSIRTIEYHEVSKGGGLPQKNHFDGGSLYTIDIMLVDTNEFTGANFMTLENDDEFKIHKFNYGDALLFYSHKYHSISELKSGLRKVLVLEVWQGEEKSCAHRCLHHRYSSIYLFLYLKIYLILYLSI
jgi:hypothetical protein